MANPRTFWATTHGNDVFHDVKLNDEKFDDDAKNLEDYYHPASQNFMRLGAEGVQWSYRPSRDLVEASEEAPSSTGPLAPQRPAITLPPLSMRFRNEYMAQRTQNGMIVEQPTEATPGLSNPYRDAQQRQADRRRSDASSSITPEEDTSPSSSLLPPSYISPESMHASLLKRTPSVGIPPAVALPVYRPRRYR